MFQIFNIPQDPNPSDAFCFDCVYRHSYIINQCSHTICLTCIYEAVDEKIRRQSKIMICPRCTDSEERRNRLGQPLAQRPNEGERESSKIEQSPKIKQEILRNQQPKLTVVSDEECDRDSSWPVGTESWYVHEIKPQRTLCLVQGKQCVSQQDCILADLSQPVNDAKDGATYDLFWPHGSESWFIHEIKPQRRPFAYKTSPEKLITCPSSSNTDKPHSLETLSGFTSNDGCGYIEPQAIKFDDELQIGMHQKLNQLQCGKIMEHVSDEPSEHVNAKTAIDSRHKHNKFKQKRKITSVRHTSKWAPDKKKLLPNEKLLNTLLCPYPLAKMIRHYRSNNRLLPQLGKTIALLFFCLLSIINCIEVLPDLSQSKTDDHTQRLTVQSKLNFNITPLTFSKRYLERSISYAKTIEILRNLESLLIYAIA